MGLRPPAACRSGPAWRNESGKGEGHAARLLLVERDHFASKSDQFALDALAVAIDGNGSVMRASCPIQLA
jgi:hypothetical protein